MNFLPIVLIIVFLLSKKGGSKSDFDLESITPLLSLFGVTEEIVKMISSDEIKGIMNGNFDLKSIIPLITSIFSQMKNSTEVPSESSYQSPQAPEYLNPIKDVASAEILSSLNSYFK